SRLLDMCFAKDNKTADGLLVAEELLRTGKAYKKFCEIVVAQGGMPEPSSETIPRAPFGKVVQSLATGVIQSIDNYHVSSIAKILGAPVDKYAGLILHKRFNEKVSKNDILVELFSTSEQKLLEAENALKELAIYTIE
ncbi:MAG: hypothetical protein AAB893_02210, partial [Patescibacteria group bacterium]